MNITDNRFLLILILSLLAWFLVYQDALLAMTTIWSRSDTFAHGYFILPISLWLLWRDKANLLASVVQPTWLALPFLTISLFVGLFAYAADISVLRQLSAVTSVIFLLWLLVGNKLVWRYKFPLVYLLFAVPMGENLIPWLQDVTAWFTVFFLHLNGIPVYVDGLYIQVPTGMFEVAVACSGIRYLIASAAVGALFGYLTYQKTYKQVLFFIFALVLPILANGIRAYGIVAIAYYSDMKYATGADHLVYGWLFFGFIIMLMFWVGGFFADKLPAKNQEKMTAVGKHNRQSLYGKYYLITLSTISLLMTSLLIMQSIPTINHLKSTPENLESNQQALTDSSWGISFNGALQQEFLLQDSGLEIFTAKYGNKQQQGEMIAWHNVMYNHDRWTVVEKRDLLINNTPVSFVHLRDFSGKPRSYLFQYQVGDFFTTNKNKAKLMQAWNSLSRQSDFSEVRAISLANIADINVAKQTLESAFSTYYFADELAVKVGAQ